IVVRLKHGLFLQVWLFFTGRILHIAADGEVKRVMKHAQSCIDHGTVDSARLVESRNAVFLWFRAGGDQRRVPLSLRALAGHLWGWHGLRGRLVSLRIFCRGLWWHIQFLKPRMDGQSPVPIDCAYWCIVCALSNYDVD